MTRFLRQLIGALTALALFNMAATGFMLAPAGPAHDSAMVEMTSGLSCKNCVAGPAVMAGCAGGLCWNSAAQPGFVVQLPIAAAVYRAEGMLVLPQHKSRPPIRPA